MNLVGPSTLPDLWRRHMLDSAQLVPLAPKGPETVWLDMGSGAGFPGLVLAILGAGRVHLVDSITKKCRFLEAVIDALGLQGIATVHNQRLEAMKPFPADAITARACAPLEKLIAWGRPFSTPDTHWLFLKGQTADDELVAAQRRWLFHVEQRESLSDPRGRLMLLTGLKKRKTSAAS
jgi:16S rRNA (guanine527-N7)-methyltransferase